MREDLKTKEIARLSDWLQANGLTTEQVLDCIHYIADEPKKAVKKKRV